MSRLNTISLRRAKLLEQIANTDCTRNLANIDHNRVFQLCDLKGIAENMARLLENYGRLLGHGEEFLKVKNELEKLNRHHERVLATMEAGVLFDEPPCAKINLKKKEKFDGKIFGYSQEQIARGQGIKELS